uniref:Peptidase_M1 domain-containing protein n=1 Tax=Macrostomum lignano TaxID=282301 RepID=A0A1I8FHJ1_9PLAT
WFGNIVTMKWWDELWLNEAFAVFTQYIGVDAFKPGWSMPRLCRRTACCTRTRSSCRLSDPNEIESMFDDISYFKGSALIRMLDAVIGRRTLKRGLIIYLNRFPCRNAASSDLFAAFSEVRPDFRAPRWVWMDLEEEKTIELDHQPKFVKINFNQTGLYRCSYEQSNWRELIRLSTEGYFDSTDVAGLLNDAFTLAYIKPAEHLRAHRAIRNSARRSPEARPRPGRSRCTRISEIGPMIAGDQQAMTDLSKFIVKILNRPLRNILSKKEAELTHMERWSPCHHENSSMRLAQNLTKATPATGSSSRTGRNEIESYSEAAKHVVLSLAMSSDVDTNTTGCAFSQRSGLRELRVWSYFERNWDIMMERYDMAFTLTEVTKFPLNSTPNTIISGLFQLLREQRPAGLVGCSRPSRASIYVQAMRPH